MLPPSQVRVLGPENGGGHGGGGRLAVGAGHADDPCGTRLQEQLDFGRRADAGLPGDLHQRVARPHRRVDHHEIGVAEVVFRMAAQMELGDRHVGQRGQRRGQRLLRRPGR